MTAAALTPQLPASGPVQPVVYKVLVNQVAITDWVLDMEIDQCYNEQEQASLRIELRRSDNMSGYVPWPVNAPVQIIWGRQPVALNNWYGYVNHYNVANADTGTKNVQYTYTLTGISKPMNTDVSTVWNNVTPTYIAKTIAAKYQLRCVVTSTNWILPVEVQANESDWIFLNRISQKTGFRFWVGNGTLYFIDPAVYIEGASSQGVPEFIMNKQPQYQDTVRNFEILKGDNLPGAVQAQRSIYGVDAATGQVFQSKAPNPTGSNVQHVNVERNVRSMDEGTKIVTAWQNLSQFWIGGQGELFGTASLYPGKLIYLSGNAFTDNNSGYWLVTSANHVLKQSGTTVYTADKYMTQVTMVRNQDATVPNITGISAPSPEICTCTLSDGVWVSTNTSVQYDGTLQV
jgi:phage protein D